MTSSLIAYALAPLAAYFLGAIPFAFVIGKSHGIDLRQTGSGNIGATNLGRALGTRYFFYAFLLDAAKGFLPTLAVALLARYTDIPDWAPLLTAAAALLGHVFPVYLGFRGGKGVATGLGVVLGVWPLFTLSGLIAATAFTLLVLTFRYISLGSILGAIIFALAVFILGTTPEPILGIHTYLPWERLWPFAAAATLFAAMIVLKHRTNIKRLLQGTESKIGQRKNP